MTAPGQALFDIHGCLLEFVSDEPDVLEWFRAGFSAFRTGAAGAPAISITACRTPAPLARPRRPLIGVRAWSLLPAPAGKRAVWYPEGALCEYDYLSDRGRIMSRDPDLLKELSYLLALSRAGEYLDLKGLHRLHAGAAAWESRALLFCGAQGAGKTTLLLELLKDNAFSLLSDDTPLIDAEGSVRGFPLRIGLGENNPHLKEYAARTIFKRRHYPPKRLLDRQEEKFQASPGLPPAFIFRLVKGSRPAFRPSPVPDRISELAGSLVAGCGVPQMAEYFVRPSPADIARKAGIAASRTGAAVALFRRARFMTFETGPEPAANADALRVFLRSGSARR